MTESALLKKFLLEYTRQGSRLFRFQSGLFWNGKSEGPYSKHKTIALEPGDVIIRKARRVRSGHPGVSDLIGFTKIQITPDMIGREVAIFTAVETKGPKGRATRQQISFIRMVNEAGGIASIAKKLEDVFKVTTNFLGGKNESH